MKKIHPFVLFLAGFGILFFGNSMTGYGPMADVIGAGIGICGDIAIVYSIWRGFVWVIEYIQRPYN